MIFELLLSFFLMEHVADDDKKKERVAIQQKQQHITWPIGCWNCRSWGCYKDIRRRLCYRPRPRG